MAITKQQAIQELARRKAIKSAPVSVAKKTSSIQSQARAELARRELQKRGLMQQKPTGVKGFLKNAGTDFGSFAKGALGIGRELITHPIYNSKQIYGVGKELVKGAPDAVGELSSNIANFSEVQRKGIESWKKLQQIPLEQQKEMLARDMQRIGESKKGNDSQKKLAQMGLGVLGGYTQYSRFGEKIYNEPFSAALDLYPTAKSLGLNKLVGKGASALNKIPIVANTTEKFSDAFVPMGKLKRLGYEDVAEDLSKTSSNMRKSQEGIIRSTVKKFEKDFKLNKAEKLDFFETIDKLRRTGGNAVSKNPKVQKAIDWYMNTELPNIKRVSGVTKKRAEVREVLSKNIAKLQEERLQVALKPKPVIAPPKVMSGVKIKATPDRYDLAAILKSVKKELSYSTNRKAPLKPNVLSKTTGKIIPATRRGRRLDNFINDQFGIKTAKKLPLDRKIATAEKILNDYKNNPDGIQNYLHHFFNPTKETNFGGKLSSPARGFLKRSKDIEGYVKDPVVSIAGVKSKAATANIKQGFINRVVKKYGKTADTITEFKGGKIIDKTTGDELMKYKGNYLPKELGEELTRLEVGEPGWLKTVLAPSRAFNRNWKPLATAVRPRYHLRNIIGNLYNASFVGGGKLRRYPEALFQQVKGHIGTQMKEGTIAGKVYKAIFKTAPERKYLRMATEDDVVGKGFFSVDINDMAEVVDKVEDFSKLIANMDSPAMVYKIPVLKQWMNTMQTFGSAIEDNARLALYIDRIKKGASRLEAKKYVNKHLFDYMNGLGEADKVIKAVIPFWSWRRFNVPLQFGALAKNPLRHLAVQQGGKPWVQQNEAENPEYKYLSQREKDMGAVKIGETEQDGKIFDKYMRTQNVLPIQDIASLSDPDNIGVSPMFDMLKQGYNLINPPENPQENLDYFGRPVESFPGEVKRYLDNPVRGTGKEILQSIPALSELNKLIGGSYSEENRPDLQTRLETAFSPTSQTIQDREKNRQYFESDYQRRFGTGTMQPGYLSELKYTAKEVLKNPNDKVATKNFRTLIDLMKQGGMSESDIKQEVAKALQAELKKESPKPKRPSSLRPKRPSPLLDPYYREEVMKRAGRLNPFFTE